MHVPNLTFTKWLYSFHSGSHFCGSGAGDETTVRGWTKYGIMVLSQGKSLTSIYSIMYTVVMALHKQDALTA